MYTRYIHIYVAVAEVVGVLGGKFRFPDESGENGGNCRRITNVDDSSAVVRTRGYSPLTCGWTERVLRHDGRRCPIVSSKRFISNTRQTEGCKDETADENITRPCASRKDNVMNFSMEEECNAILVFGIIKKMLIIPY